MASIVTYKYIKQNPDIMEYIRRADQALKAQGYTEHSFAHVEIVAQHASMILSNWDMMNDKLSLPELQV